MEKEKVLRWVTITHPSYDPIIAQMTQAELNRLVLIDATERDLKIGIVTHSDPVPMTADDVLAALDMDELISKEAKKYAGI